MSVQIRKRPTGEVWYKDAGCTVENTSTSDDQQEGGKRKNFNVAKNRPGAKPPAKHNENHGETPSQQNPGDRKRTAQAEGGGNAVEQVSYGKT